MVFNYYPSDVKHYAQTLRFDGERRMLVWDSAPGHDVLLVQTPFGQSAEERMEALCQKLPGLAPGAFAEVLPGIYARYITVKEKARNGGCPLNAEMCSYTVFACLPEGDSCAVYAPLHRPMNPAVYDAPKEVEIGVSPVNRMVRVGLFHQNEVFAGYFRLSFPKNFDRSCACGALHYRVGGHTIPITPMMAEEGSVYVRSDERPEVFSTNRGLKLIFTD